MNDVIVKICGITTLEDALNCAEVGADMLGFNFYRRSPRFIEPAQAAMICDGLRTQLGAACPVLVGVFVNEVVGVISAITRQVGLQGAQLCGDESAEMLRELRGIGYKAIRPASRAQALDDVAYFTDVMPESVRFPSILLDAYHPELYGGTGEQASNEVAFLVRSHVPRLMLAGGLTPGNVAMRVAAIRPWGVDVASGVEVSGDPRRKDAALVRAFVQDSRGVLN